MLIAGATTLLAIAAVIGVIGYRVFKAEGSAPADVTALLPKGASVISAAVAEDRIAVTLDVGGAIEIRTFDAKTLKPTGRLPRDLGGLLQLPPYPRVVTPTHIGVTPGLDPGVHPSSHETSFAEMMDRRGHKPVHARLPTRYARDDPAPG